MCLGQTGVSAKCNLDAFDPSVTSGVGTLVALVTTLFSTYTNTHNPFSKFNTVEPPITDPPTS